MGESRNSKILRFSFVLNTSEEVDNLFGRELVRRITEKLFPSMKAFFESEDSKKVLKVFGPYRGRSGIVFDVASPSYEITYLILKAFKEAKRENSEIVFLGRYEKFPNEVRDRKVLRLKILNAIPGFSMKDELARSGYDMWKFHGIEPSFSGLRRIRTLWFRKSDLIDALVEIECERESCFIVEFLRFRGVGSESHLGFGDVVISESSS